VHPKDFGMHSSILRSFQGPALPYDPSYHLLYRGDKIRAYVESERPDVLEIHSPYVAAVAALRCEPHNFGIRTLVWHSDFIDTYEQLLVRSAPWLTRLVQPLSQRVWAWPRRIARSCDATFVASAFLKEKLDARGFERVQLLPFGVQKHVFRPDAADRLAARASLGLPEDAILLLAIGRFAVEKQFGDIIEAFAKVAPKLPRAVLLLVGDGPERAALERRAHAVMTDAPGPQPRIRFLGFERERTRLAQWLASADALMHACPYETFGLGVAEALACGLPAALPDRGGTAAWRALDSVLAYPSHNVAALAEATLALVGRSLEERRARGIRSASQIWSEQEHFAQLLERYTMLLENKHKNMHSTCI
jgi:alpha-1,6-mannosyltransferase